MSKRIKNLSRVFLDKHKKKLEETWKNWVSKLNSRLSFYNRLPAVEKCLNKSIDKSGLEDKIPDTSGQIIMLRSLSLKVKYLVLLA